ncbi:hypothetical protein [Verrucomicrobium spinosum]|uniref:hypothetical protein n=1 Tax=Verrucomicrobium spinosum TaxID=2736 RepID=UPI0001744D6C|nr:hypothetical protein [Verrucomicrobium spinosum]
MKLRLSPLQFHLGSLTLAMAFAPLAGASADPPKPEIFVVKPKLAPRPLPGTTTAQDKGTEVQPPVIPFIPAPEPSPAADLARAAPIPLDMDRARILVVRRSGTFKIPPRAVPEAGEPATGDTAEASVPITLQEPLAEGKIRIIPRALVPPTSPAPPTKP